MQKSTPEIVNNVEVDLFTMQKITPKIVTTEIPSSKNEKIRLFWKICIAKPITGKKYLA
jgi:hypothetical protein